MIIFGVVGSAGEMLSGNGFTVEKMANTTGQYQITFNPSFAVIPAIVGSQTGYDSPEDTRDNVVFPFVSVDSTQATTGDSTGAPQDRQFSFIAIGPD